MREAFQAKPAPEDRDPRIGRGKREAATPKKRGRQQQAAIPRGGKKKGKKSGNKKRKKKSGDKPSAFGRLCPQKRRRRNCTEIRRGALYLFLFSSSSFPPFPTGTKKLPYAPFLPFFLPLFSFLSLKGVKKMPFFLKIGRFVSALLVTGGSTEIG